MNSDISLAELYQLFSQKSELLHRFADKLNNYAAVPRDYGSGVRITMAEIHLLTTIADNPGITAAALAEMKEKTPSAISQILKELQEEGLIERKPHPDHSKKLCNYVTPKGQQLSDLHKMWDIQHIQDTLNHLLKVCTMEEIDTFFRVVELYCSDALMQDQS